MLQEFAARSSILLRYLGSLVKGDACIVYRVSCRASLIPSRVSNLDFFFFHCSMKYIQIHNPILCNKSSKMQAGYFVYCWTLGHSESHCPSPFPRQLCRVLRGYSVQHLAPAIVPKATWLSKCCAGNGSLCLICPWTWQRNKFGLMSRYISPVLHVRGIRHGPANTHAKGSFLHSQSLYRGIRG